jgi:hypothetical protein
VDAEHVGDHREALSGRVPPRSDLYALTARQLVIGDARGAGGAEAVAP